MDRNIDRRPEEQVSKLFSRSFIGPKFGLILVTGLEGMPLSCCKNPASQKCVARKYRLWKALAYTFPSQRWAAQHNLAINLRANPYRCSPSRLDW